MGVGWDDVRSNDSEEREEIGEGTRSKENWVLEVLLIQRGRKLGGGSGKWGGGTLGARWVARRPPREVPGRFD